MKKYWSWPIRRAGFFLITFDKDFGELAVVRGQAHAGIIRIVILSAAQQAPTCLMVLNRYGTELQSGAIVTVEPGRVRVRPAASHPESS
jgi:predicted nuclease of predicted toxin-antitoxin system